MAKVKGSVAVVVRHIHKLADAHQESQATDRELLQQFVGRHDEAAFEALFRRHDAMVLAVGRRILGDPDAAEDVCQAAFLLLAQKAASQRWQPSVASWLYKTAQHLALKARTATARRSRREGRSASPVLTTPLTEITGQELLAVLDEELIALPEPLRAPLVLCYLEGATRDEAARQLGCRLATLKKRLERGRERLHAALVRRGIGLSVALLGTLLLGGKTNPADAAGLVTRTARAAVALAAGQPVAGLVSSRVVQLIEGGLTTMFGMKYKSGLAILLVGSLIALGGVLGLAARADKQTTEPPKEAPAPQKPGAKPGGDKDPSETATFRGCVLDPDGKPLKGAELSLAQPWPGGEATVRATTGEDGRFDFSVRRGEVAGVGGRLARSFQVVAAAKGYGAAWTTAEGAADNDLTLRLAKDDVPVEGRILTLEGQPVAGAKVSLIKTWPLPGGELESYLRALKEGQNPTVNENARSRPLIGPAPHQQGTTTTDAEGRFRLVGTGRDRLVRLMVEAPGIHNWPIEVLTREGQPETTGQAQADPTKFYGAKFEHRAQPGRIIKGVVREKGTNKPLAGIYVVGGHSQARTKTDEQGRYELPGHAKNKDYYIEAQSETGEHFRGVVAVADTAGLGAITAPDIELIRGIPFHGKVVDKATGKPVRGVAEYLPLWPNADAKEAAGAFRYGGFTRATISEDGTFSLGVLPGPGAVTVTADGDYTAACVDPQAFFKDKMGDAARQTGNRTLLNRVGALYQPTLLVTPQDSYQAIVLIHPDKDAKEVREEAALEPARKLKGTVLGPDGKPLAGARLQGLKEAFSMNLLGGAEFTMNAPNPQRPPVTLVAVHEGERLVGTLAVKGDEKDPLEIRLQPWGTLTGRLVKDDGKPWALVEVMPSNQGPSLNQPGRVKTDKDGNFRLEGLIPGVKYRLAFVEFRENQPVTGKVGEEVTLKEGETRSLGDVTCRPVK